jgi:hypothetical protein
MATLLKHTVKPSGGDYTTLDACLDHLVAAHANFVTSDVYGEIEIGGDWDGAPDTASAVLNGLTLDATHDLKIYTDAANRAKASAWDTTRYILAVSNAVALTIQDDYVWADGLQINTPAINANSQHCVYIGAGITATNNHIRLSNLRLKGAANGTYYQRGVSIADADTIFDGWNIIAYDFSPALTSGQAFASSGATSNFYNCLAYNCYIGFFRDNGTCNVYDSVAFKTSNDFSGTITADYCASDDNDGTNNVAESGGGAEWPDDFTDAAGGDFTLKATSALVGAGGKAGSSLFSDDIDGTARGAAWDVGAHEYVSAAATNVVMNIV